ncbi:sensor histidine kinase [Archangium violaceum]|uniref:sensor histidine kinase n=1 Tax=Archangium violaceum TaxID=83451 RepID=UPI00193C7F28|nr:sensor histidine kinase [Archangium violaceum]QRK04761.1 sensor histidine kinase [Archangium violaceum]
MLRIRLRAKLMLGVSLVLLPLLGLLLFGLEENYEMRRTSLLNGMLQTATTSGLLIDASLQEMIRLAQAVSAESASHALRPGELQDFITRLARERTDLVNLAVFDASGRPVASATPGPEGLDISDRPYFQEAIETKEAVVSELLIGRTVKRPVVVVAAPVLDGNKQARGVVTVSLRLDQLARRMLEIGLRPGQALFVVDPHGRLVFHTSRLEATWEEREISQWKEIQEALAGDPVLTTEFRGLFRDDHRIAALTPTPQHGWLVGVTWGYQEAFEDMSQVRQLQLAAFLTISLLVLAGAWALAGYLSGRVSRVVAHARTLGRGELGALVPIEPSLLGTGDELDELTEAFNHMASELKAEREQRETFIASVSHDLKNLTTPLSLAARLLRDPSRQSPEARERTLTRLSHQTTRIERLVADLLDASRLDAGHFNLFHQRHDLMKLVRGILDEQQEGTSTHRLVLEGPESFELEADPERLAQVLTNLVSNGIKYSPEGGVVSVTVSEAEGTVRVQVTDNGIGLQPQELDEVFEPYARTAAARKIRGLGLGLYICRAIIEGHGGTLCARSEGRGKGSTFLFTLPTRPRSGGATAR